MLRFGNLLFKLSLTLRFVSLSIRLLFRFSKLCFSSHFGDHQAYCYHHEVCFSTSIGLRPRYFSNGVNLDARRISIDFELALLVQSFLVKSEIPKASSTFCFESSFFTLGGGQGVWLLYLDDQLVLMLKIFTSLVLGDTNLQIQYLVVFTRYRLGHKWHRRAINEKMCGCHEHNSRKNSVIVIYEF